VTSDLFTTIPEHISKVIQIHSPQNTIATSLFIMRHWQNRGCNCKRKTTEKMESIIEAEIDFGFQFRAERFILALKLLRADARSGRA
jgi:hypothetical protein